MSQWAINKLVDEIEQGVFAISYRTVDCDTPVANEAKLVGKLMSDPHADMKPKSLNCATQVRSLTCSRWPGWLHASVHHPGCTASSVRTLQSGCSDRMAPSHVGDTGLLHTAACTLWLTLIVIHAQGALTTESNAKVRAVVKKPTPKPTRKLSAKLIAYRKAIAGGPPCSSPR